MLAFPRAGDGSLDTVGAYSDRRRRARRAAPALAGLGRPDGDGRHLLVANAGSDDVRVFAVGSNDLLLAAAVPSGGATPRSIAEHDGSSTSSTPATRPGRLPPRRGRARADRRLRARAARGGRGPGAGRFTPGRLDARRHRARHRLDRRLPRGAGDGPLGEPASIPRRDRPRTASPSRATGRWSSPRRSARRRARQPPRRTRSRDGERSTPVTASVGNGRSEICWAVVTKDGRFAFTTNFADGAVSRYAIGADGSLTLEDATAGIAVDGQTGPPRRGPDRRRALPLRDRRRRAAGSSAGPSARTARLTPIGSWEGLPATVAGLAAS